jgi:hypothetical protein
MSIFLQTLASANSVYVSQKFELAEIFGFETRNRYLIKTEDGQQFGYCAEPKIDFFDAIMRQFLGHWRVFNLVATDMNDPFLLEAMKRFQAGQIDKETLLALLKPNKTES